ncbi:formyltransferase family protein [Duganella sp. Root198D2]|uniref:formyltransferase family protein n=1 Tax=Duganella sp. Root198D2 TaxID=1736489 RepID=UPI0009E8BDEA|nr:formyltransferase family protein [Duganella sp. Root198D2]
MDMTRPARIALFGSFYRGFHVLTELLKGPVGLQVMVVGVATDDAGASFVSPARRVWAYPHSACEAAMVETLAGAHGLPVYKGRVKSELFYREYEEEWRPDLCIAATFGQRIDARLRSFPRFGFFNLHPCIDDGWPSGYAGPNPFQALLDDGSDHAVIALHEVDEGFDTGRLVALSERIYFPPAASVVDLHKCTSPLAAKFLVQQLGKLLAVTSLKA